MVAGPFDTVKPWRGGEGRGRGGGGGGGEREEEGKDRRSRAKEKRWEKKRDDERRCSRARH